MLECSHFLAGYSDYRDGLLDAARSEQFRSHLAECASCARYDRVVGEGVDVLLGRCEIEPSADFSLRLQQRLLSLEREAAAPRSGSGAPTAVMMAIALAIGAAAWVPALRQDPSPVMLRPILAHAPRHPQVVPPPFRTTPVLAVPVTAPVRARPAEASYFSEATGQTLATPTLVTYPLVRQ